MAGPAYSLRLPTRPALLWRVMVLGLTMGALLARVLAWMDGDPFRGVPSLFIMALAVPSVLLWYVALAAHAGPAGMKLFDGWGLPRRVAWEDLRAASLARWPYMLYAPALKVELADGRVRWLPRETQRLGELHKMALARLGAEHPFVRALETPLHRL